MEYDSKARGSNRVSLFLIAKKSFSLMERRMTHMILLIITILILLIATFLIGTCGLGFLLIFGDVIIFLAIIVLIIKKIFKRKK